MVADAQAFARARERPRHHGKVRAADQPPSLSEERPDCVEDELEAAALTGAPPPTSSPSPSWGLSTGALCGADALGAETAGVGGEYAAEDRAEMDIKISGKAVDASAQPRGCWIRT
jgi:hypothetical protein